MIDHVGFPVSSHARSKTFYEKALAPLGYVLIMEVQQNEHDAKACGFGFGPSGKPDFWIGGEGGLNKPVHIAIAAKDRAAVDAFYKAALAAGAKDNGPPGLRPHYHASYTAPSCSIPTGTTSRPSVTGRGESARGHEGSVFTPA
jgi:catechol 2,3-dioxygenase-like lactoylglutathione lyase family enzyme